MAKDLIRGIKKTGTRGGKDFKTVSIGTGYRGKTNPLSKPEKELLESTTRVKQLERQEQEAEFTQKTFYKVPYPIYIG